MKKLTFCAVGVFALMCSAFGQTPRAISDKTSLIAVVGEAEIKIDPDQAKFTIEVVSNNPDLNKAKMANDEGVAKTLLSAREIGIKDADIQTESYSLSPTYESGTWASRRIIIGYEVTKRLVVTMKDLTKMDLFLSKAISSGVNRVVDVTFENSDQTKYQAKVRALAVRNAEEKATAYAGQLKQKIGRAVAISEEGAELSMFGSPVGYGIGNGSGSGDGSGDGDDLVPSVTFAMGKITISEKIYVTFILD